MNVGYLITGRLKSTRLPKKLLLKINEKEIIYYMIERLKKVGAIDKIVICTSVNNEDDPLEALANEYGIGCFRGSEEDVIGRLYGACVKYGFDYVLNITADCPLVSTEYVDAIIDKYKETNADLIRAFDLPHGAYSYGIKVEALKKVCEIKKSNETEVWGKYFTDTGLFNVVDLKVDEKHRRPEIRMTLDYPEDFEFFKTIINHFSDKILDIKLSDILEYLDENPEVVSINSKCEELYKKRWEQQNKLEV